MNDPADTLDVSVLLPAFNARGVVGRAIDSVIAQTHASLELIVVDDASTDGTADFVADRYRDEARLQVMRSPINGGPARARNIGLGAARGAWVALVDADDAWRPERLARMLAVAGGGADAVFDNLCGFDGASGRETGPVFPRLPEGGIGVADLLDPRVEGSDLDYGYLKPLMRRAFLDGNAIRYDEALRAGEDLTLYLDLLLAGAAVRAMSEPLYLYTMPAANRGTLPAHSHTVPNDAAVVRALQRLAARRGVGPGHPARAAIEARMDHLRRVGPVASFYHARRKRDLKSMLRLAAAEPAVRGEIYRKVGGLLARQVTR